MKSQLIQFLTGKNAFIFIIIALAMLWSNLSNAQHFEVGPQLGYGYTNISESTGFFKPSDIGKNVWKPNFGANAVYYFKDPYIEKSFLVGLIYRSNTRGSISPVDENSKFEIKSQTIGLYGGLGYPLGENFIFYYQVGIGMNFFDNEDYYEGDPNQDDIFDYVDETVELKSSEFTAVYGIGLATDIIQDRFSLFLELNGDTGLSDINKAYDELKTQLFGIGLGLRYKF